MTYFSEEADFKAKGLHYVTRMTYFSEEADFKAKGLGIPGACIEVVSHEQDQLEDLLELLAALHLLACLCRGHQVLHTNNTAGFKIILGQCDIFFF